MLALLSAPALLPPSRESNPLLSLPSFLEQWIKKQINDTIATLLVYPIMLPMPLVTPVVPTAVHTDVHEAVGVALVEHVRLSDAPSRGAPWSCGDGGRLV